MFFEQIVHQWRVFSIVVVTLVNFPRNSHVLRDFLPVKFAFHCLGPTPSSVNSLQTTCILTHILAWGKVHAGSNQMRSPHCRLWNMILFSSFNLFWLVRRTETGKYLWLETIGVKLESLYAFHRKITWKTIFEATSCYRIT